MPTHAITDLRRLTTTFCIGNISSMPCVCPCTGSKCQSTTFCRARSVALCRPRLRVCACVCACMHACVHACARATPPVCKHLYTSICACAGIFDKCVCMNACIGHLCHHLQPNRGNCLIPLRPWPTIHNLRCSSLQGHCHCCIVTITATVASSHPCISERDDAGKT